MLYLFSGIGVSAALTFGTMAAIVALVAVAVARWSRRGGWDERYVLTLAAGALTFWLFFSPLYELAAHDVIDAAATALIAAALALWVWRLYREATLRDAAAPRSIAMP